VPTKPPTRIHLRWIEGLTFSVHAGHRETILDGNSHAGLSPVELLGTALAGCMATDVAWILTRGRQDLRTLDVSLVADRASHDPHRFVHVRIHFAATGAVNSAQLDRAIALSHDKYCSVWHTLRQDLPLELTSSITPHS
jgi:putative redox protein